jgi:hypothetical protein
MWHGTEWHGMLAAPPFVVGPQFVTDPEVNGLEGNAGVARSGSGWILCFSGWLAGWLAGDTRLRSAMRHIPWVAVYVSFEDLFV